MARFSRGVLVQLIPEVRRVVSRVKVRRRRNETKVLVPLRVVKQVAPQLAGDNPEISG